MGCCNQPPKGGSTEIKPLLKAFAGLFVAILLIAFIFG